MTSLIVLDRERESHNVVTMKDGEVVCGNVALEGSFFIMSDVKIKRSVRTRVTPVRVLGEDGYLSRPFSGSERDYAVSVSRVSVRESTVVTIKSYLELPSSVAWATKDEATAQEDADRAQAEHNREAEETNAATYAKLRAAPKGEFVGRATREWGELPWWKVAWLTVSGQQKKYVERQSEVERTKFLTELDARLVAAGFDLEKLSKGVA